MRNEKLRLTKEEEQKRIEEIARRLGLTDEDLSDDALARAEIPPDLEERIRELAGKSEEELIDVGEFEPMSLDELRDILSLTIKYDDPQKVITFLCMLSAYTESSQFNISFNSPSATGKSYIPLEVAKLFPKDDLIELAYCSPTAFFHDVGGYSDERNEYIVDLSRKILILLDMPHMELLAKLRPLFSHDKKEILLKITDKQRRAGLRTKNVKIVGYPAVIFCSASMRLDEQEATRFLLLSPDTTMEKLYSAIDERIRRESHFRYYEDELERNPQRALLKRRILAIRQAKVADVIISDADAIKRRFLGGTDRVLPRHTRDIGRVMSLIKAIALLNLWFRERVGDSIVADERDVEAGLELYDGIRACQELNIPPYIYDIYKTVICPAYREKLQKEKSQQSELDIGITKREVIQKYYQIYKRYLSMYRLDKEVIPSLEMAGLIHLEPDPSNKRTTLIKPVAL